jgi:hypothetical protein
MNRRRPTTFPQWFCLFVVAMFSSCTSKPPQPSNIPLFHAGVRTWEGRAFDRVVGYRFADSSEWRSVLRLDLHTLDLAYLQKMKRNEAVLSEAQIDQLMDAIFGPHPFSDIAMCYEPHHIFIFFDKDRPIGAFEFCFQCLQYRAWPKKDLGVHESYEKLATLCKKLGLGIKPPKR